MNQMIAESLELQQRTVKTCSQNLSWNKLLQHQSKTLPGQLSQNRTYCNPAVDLIPNLHCQLCPLYLVNYLLWSRILLLKDYSIHPSMVIALKMYQLYTLKAHIGRILTNKNLLLYCFFLWFWIPVQSYVYFL